MNLRETNHRSEELRRARVSVGHGTPRSRGSIGNSWKMVVIHLSRCHHHHHHYQHHNRHHYQPHPHHHHHHHHQHHHQHNGKPWVCVPVHCAEHQLGFTNLTKISSDLYDYQNNDDEDEVGEMSMMKKRKVKMIDDDDNPLSIQDGIKMWGW